MTICVFSFSRTYRAIYDEHHRENDIIVLKFTAEAEQLYNAEQEKVTKLLNEKWDKCDPFDSSLSKIHWMWIRVEAVLTVFYNHLDRKLHPGANIPVDHTISIENLKYAMNLVKYFSDQKTILLSVCKNFRLF